MKTITVSIFMNNTIVKKDFRLKVLSDDEIEYRIEKFIELVKTEIISGENEYVQANDLMVEISKFTYKIS